MKESLIEFKQSYLEILLSFLWRQWSAIGVAGYANSQDSWYIDPEALLIFSCSIARYDARLFDEIIDWISINGNLINIQRLKNMAKNKSAVNKRILSAITESMPSSKERKFFKWKGLIGNPEMYDSLESLFYFRDGRPMPQIGSNEAVFEKYGFSRGKLKLREHSQSVNIIFNTGLLFKLRALFGTNARSEIILYLLTQESAHPSLIAKETFYSQKNIQDIIIEMVQSGLIFVRPSGKEKHYRLKEEKWYEFLGLDLNRKVQWVNWHLLFNALEQIWLKINQKDFLTYDSLLQSSELRAVMHKINPDIESSGFAEALSDDKFYLGEEYLQVFLTDIKRLLG